MFLSLDIILLTCFSAVFEKRLYLPKKKIRTGCSRKPVDRTRIESFSWCTKKWNKTQRAELLLHDAPCSWFLHLRLHFILSHTHPLKPHISDILPRCAFLLAKLSVSSTLLRPFRSEPLPTLGFYSKLYCCLSGCSFHTSWHFNSSLKILVFCSWQALHTLTCFPLRCLTRCPLAELLIESQKRKSGFVNRISMKLNMSAITNENIIGTPVSFIWFFPTLKGETFCLFLISNRTSLVAQMIKNLPAMRETRVWSLGWEDPLEKGMATHSSILAWRISWTEEPGGLQYMGLRRVEHNLVTNASTFT